MSQFRLIWPAFDHSAVGRQPRRRRHQLWGIVPVWRQAACSPTHTHTHTHTGRVVGRVWQSSGGQRSWAQRLQDDYQSPTRGFKIGSVCLRNKHVGLWFPLQTLLLPLFIFFSSRQQKHHHVAVCVCVCVWGWMYDGVALKHQIDRC